MEVDSVVALNNVSVFQKNKLVLSNVSLNVNRSEFVYLIGKTGSGKSSLLQMLYAELPAQGDDADVCGYDLKKISKKKVPFLRRKLGIIFQDYQLLSDRSVFENLKFVLKATGWKDKTEINNRILDVLSEVGLVGKINALPHQLSGGEQQRVAIARAILNKPELILADEPTGNLDPGTSNEIIRLLSKICEDGTSVLMATHNYNLIQKFPHRIVKCEEGSLLDSNN
ncbi:MAG: ATP-binding cassette domain-containing protein [Bacteroidales bacterium]|nr:ATP-binding cassette domain-containing protein [Bacteroidales bacterium]